MKRLTTSFLFPILGMRVFNLKWLNDLLYVTWSGFHFPSLGVNFGVWQCVSAHATWHL